ncbi:SDR family NAD(P)-dependent oxidoreductase [Roseibium sp.]|uniref:SDR family NAD(P)-dependent oxidoreductase n=1 Tax=Roseibium sp. TaxID=1936156 RepID=UPI003A97B8BB
MAQKLQREPVAIVGLGLRLPGADNLDEFWDHLAAERSLIREVPADRWNAGDLKGNPSKGNKTNSIWGGFVEDADCFDAAFFGISPREAAWMDPQQRFALEMAWHAIEDAGYRASDLAGSNTGVFMGVCHWDYAELLEKHQAQIDAYMPTGIAFSIIANRVSHFFDFQGPSITNDTACAASLTSVYEAVRAIQDGTCEMALAGGVNLIWSPNHFVAFSKAGMLSKDGRGKAFDDAADGYVRGEGGAVLLLKPLSKALEDGDAIHAVIRGIGINHGGRTNSLTVTNPKAQAELIRKVHREAGASPDTINYIEAHGPGTPLGDPIEISGLKQAFETLCDENDVVLEEQTCGIGSVKTNIGHLEGAAGVAGIVKVLAALKHEQIPANAGFNKLNRLIDLSGSPFRIQSACTDWPRSHDHIRRACVSSFGFGGSNAHVLMEEAPEQRSSGVVKTVALHVIPLSAASEEGLTDYAERLLAFVKRTKGRDAILANLAHTFQMARAPLEMRCAFAARTTEELADALRSYLNGSERAGCVLPETASAPKSGKVSEDVATALRWVAGEDVSWGDGATAPRRAIHAPLYPFTRERHWMDLSLGAKDQRPVPHPLLHRNTSLIDGCRFETRLTGDEFVLSDHHVGDTKVLPGVASLEMGRAAAELAGGLPSSGFAITNVVWSKPIQLLEAQPVFVETLIERKSAQRLDFSVRTCDVAGPQSAAANMQGRIETGHAIEPATADLEDLKGRCGERLDPQVCYERLLQSGVNHGPAFRAMAQVYRGENEALALLKLPRRLQQSLEAMPLHPVLLDAAIQAWVAIDKDAPGGAGVPFSCGRIEVLAPCTAVMWAHVRMRKTQSAASPVRHLDIDLFDKEGHQTAVIRDLVLRILSPAEDTVSTDVAKEGTALEPVDLPLVVMDGGWHPAPLQITAGRTKGTTRLLLAGMDAALASSLRARTGCVVDLLPDLSGLDNASAAKAVFLATYDVVRDTLASRAALPGHILVFAPTSLPSSVTAPLAGLLKTAVIENPKLSGRVVTLDGDMTVDRLVAIASSESFGGDSLTELRYDAGGLRSAWLPVSETDTADTEALTIDPDGVYWITGGLGELGHIFARWIITRGARRLVLSGRRQEADDAGRARLDALRKDGVEVVYTACNVADLADVDRVVRTIQGTVGDLKGIIHAAGILDDGYILTRDAADVVDVLAPKVIGSVHLDQATRSLPIDFYILCSSIASVFGNAGQAGYAAANAFMDAFAEERAALVARGDRFGKTVAIAWPLWQDGGMTVDASTQAAMKRRLGLTPLPTDAGLAALEAILQGPASPRSTVLYGDLDRIDAVLADYGQTAELNEQTTNNATIDNSEPKGGFDDAALLPKTIDLVRTILSDVLELEVGRIRSNRKLDEYGLDSIAIVESTNRLEEALGPLSKTLFFEFVDLDGVGHYLVAEHRAALETLFADDLAAIEATSDKEAELQDLSAPRTIAAEAASVAFVASAPEKGVQSHKVPTGDERGQHDIAIVGLSLHVSNADSQDAFWTMLSEGIDGFEPVPAERWNNGALLHGERDILGKTVVKTGAFLPDIDKFDPRYFRISQAEAELMSPEVRLFLQASVEAFEDAGYSRETMARKLSGDVAVIVGSMTNEYDLYGFQNMLMRGSLASGSYTGTVPNMVSYYYGFTGPSYFLDTMCSASSTCVHEAVHMLRAGRCKMALAGGVSLLLHPQKLIATSQEHFTTKSADVIRGYGLGAEGTILGEGVGALVLKPLVDAQRDGDHIYGVITGSGISNAGVRNGFTVPSPNQQAVAIEQALDDAGISPATIGYIEGHGSGTALGDPIEIKALTQVFRKHTDAVQTCPIGTVKSNVAHLLGASGLAGIVKVLSQLKHKQLAPSLHAETLNLDIPFAASPFYVQRDLAPWQRLSGEDGQELPLRAGVTSIGAGGMNSHIIIEEAAEPLGRLMTEGSELLVFSALGANQLRAVLTRFCAYLQDNSDAALADIAFTLQVGRNELTSRLALVADSRLEALDAIKAFLGGEPAAGFLQYTASILDCDPPSDVQQIQAACVARDLKKVAAAWSAGASIDWDLLRSGRDVRRISLPAYPFEKIRCWYQEEPDVPSVVNPLGARSKLHPFIGLNCSDATGLRYKTTLHLKELRDYVFAIAGKDTVIATVAVDIIAAAAQISGVASHPGISSLEILQAPVWQDVKDLELEVKPGSDRSAVTVSVVTHTGQCSPWLSALVADVASAGDRSIDISGLRKAALRVQETAEVYANFQKRRVNFGPYLESIQQIWHLPDGAHLCHLREDQPQQDFFKRQTHLPAPALGAALQVLQIVTGDNADIDAIETIELRGSDVSYILCQKRADGGFDLAFCEADGSVSASMFGVTLRSRASAEQSPTRKNKSAVSSPGAFSEVLHSKLREMAAAILKFTPADLSAREAFHDLGFDSISLTRYANDISEAFGIDLSPAVFFEYEHIEALAEHLVTRHGVMSAQTEKTVTPVETKASSAFDDVKISGGGAQGDHPLPSESRDAEPDARIAIIGMAGRFPGSPDVETYFDNLLAGQDLTSGIPLARYSPSYAERFRKLDFSGKGGFLEDIDRFDAGFFKISPVEAERLDPQQRLLLETSWRALENAGYTPEELPRQTGVFVGITSLDYADVWRSEGLETDGYLATGNSLAMAANRLSHQFNLNGPSQAIDTACSSSLIALLRARDALRMGQCSAAIVGGVNLCLSLDGFEGPHKAGMLSPTGHCHTFGAAADGYTRGEGVAALLLKPLAEAERDGDRILGVLAGGAENHGGRSGALTAPNAKVQARLIVEAMAGLDPASISYIEAHGTGTELGDPVEINGLRSAFAQLSVADQHASLQIGLGSVKSNIGHLEAVAGLAGVIKVLMAMDRGLLPATLFSEPLNPHIDLDGTPFKVLTRQQVWEPQASGAPRRAGVSSFGFGGANAHVVLESYDKPSGHVRSPLARHEFANTRFWIPGVEPQEAASSRCEDQRALLFSTDWKKAAGSGTPFTGRRIAIGCGIRIAVGRNASVRSLSLVDGDIATQYAGAASQLLEMLRVQMTAMDDEAVLIQLAVPADGEGAVFGGLGAMLRTAMVEDRRVVAQVIETPVTTTPEAVADWLEENAQHAGVTHIRYENGGCYIRQWQELNGPESRFNWNDGGVYLVTGGMGGLGRLVAEDIARTAINPVLVLTGSKPLDDERSAFLDRLRELGAVAGYRQANVADFAAVDRLVRHILEVHGHLNGVVHCSGVLRDGYIATKSSEDLKAVLAPKIHGALALRDACAALDLDAFVLFSSLASPFGNVGQADYAAANGFLDALAATSNGKITSINWPLWLDGGMAVDVTTKEALFRRMGQRPLETTAGLEALHRCLASGKSQVAVVAGAHSSIKTFFAAAATDSGLGGSHTASEVASSTALDPALLSATRSSLRKLFAKVSGVSEQAIDPDALLEDYGIDSLMITRLNTELAGLFEALPKTLFFRFRTLAAISVYLVGEQTQACRSWTGFSGSMPSAMSGPSHKIGSQRSNSVGAADAAKQEIRPASQDEPIAIIGLSGTYPDAPDLTAFWRNLETGRDSVREIPADRWEIEGFFEPDQDEAAAGAKSYSKWGAFLEGFADFDPAFFKISPREAAAMDPHERLFLMSAWQALEDGGYTRDRLKAVAGTSHGSAEVGVFAGVTKTGYALHGPFRTDGGAVIRPSTSFSGLANRVSQFLDLSGPSLPVDTMCSSSLTAIHEACSALRSGSCAIAIAGGVNLYLHPSNYVELSAAHMLSPSGRCHSFGSEADGFVPGEGVGCVVLKPLSKAVADGDRIHAVIRGSAVNHGGRTNGFTVPNPQAQRDVIRKALDQAGLQASEIGYIEAHGTGTELGDPIEVDGLTQAFALDTDASGFCVLGSVKSNIGHLEAAAGVAGVTKAILQLKRRRFVPSLHAQQINPNIDLEKSPFVLCRETRSWETVASRIAGISSFGAGGANAHVIIEEWSDAGSGTHEEADGGGPHAIILSGRTPEKLREQAEQLLAYLHATADGQVSDKLPDLAQVSDSLCAELGRLLNVHSRDIDPEDTFDALGLDVAHAYQLVRWLKETFGPHRSIADIEMAGTVERLSQSIASTPCESLAVGASPRLQDIAYTLQVGREDMDARLGLLVRDGAELVETLASWLAGSEPEPPVFVGEAQGQKAKLSALGADDVIEEVISRAWDSGRYETVLRLWVEGLTVPWLALRKSTPERIISLPTYPFDRTRFWIPEQQRASRHTQTQPTSFSELRREVEAGAGDTVLRDEQDALDIAIAGVLYAMLPSLSVRDIAPAYRRWFESVKPLVASRAHQLKASDGDAWAHWEKQKAEGRSSAQMQLAEAALRALPDILTGQTKATEVLFPDGRQSLVEAVYKENAVAARFSRAAANVAAQAVKAVTASQAKLRILEIGAGTGGTTEPVLDALIPFANRIGEYLYTDLSRAFLIHAERSYADRIPGFKTALLNVEKPIADQKIEAGSYDLVIAANVLHATADIRDTLENVRQMMAPGGVLLLNETSKATLFTHVTFGLLEGWWRFTDPERRIPGTPSLDTENWRKALGETGFDWIAASSAEEQDLGQQIIVARADTATPHAPQETLRSVGPSRSESMPASVAALVAPTGVVSSAISTKPAGVPRLRAVLRQALADTLNVAASLIDEKRSFADYGLDSILGAEFVHRLRKVLGVDLDQTALYDFTNAQRLEAHLRDDHSIIVGEEMVDRPAVATPEPRSTTAPVMAQGEHEAIAIVGASGRFAKSETIDELWQHLISGRDLVEPVSRFDLTRFYKDQEEGSYGRHGSFLAGIDQFDPVFFGISGTEATYMDPQQRLFLEEAWSTLENAGHAGEDIIGSRCGVFVGCAHGDYQDLFTEQPPGQAFWGNTTSLIPARISYWLDLKGPAVAVDTACSSSLVALHMACQSIRNGECDMALAGGVFVQCSSRFFRYANAAQMLSPSGRCAAFGKGADGIVPGEAVGAVLLRPLSDALSDGDTILGVIAASGTNQDGTTNGITAPSALSQERLIRQVYEQAGIDASSIGFVEAHGTGTVLGDPIEHAALLRAFSDAEPDGGKIHLGSVKSNIGHATTAAGIVGLAKVLWSLKQGSIPPTLHFAGGNSAIDFNKGPFTVNEQPVAWSKVTGTKRRAAISSFGFSGTNAHVVIEDGPEESSISESASGQLFVLSARTEDQLGHQAKRLNLHLERHSNLLPEDVAFTLIAGRRHLAHRLAVVARDLQELQIKLESWMAGQATKDLETGHVINGGSTSTQATEPAGIATGSGETARALVLARLAKAYVAGGQPVPGDLFVSPRKRVPLPSYPFARKSYWVSEAPPAATRSDTALVQAVSDDTPASTDAAASGERQCATMPKRVLLQRPAAMAEAVGARDVVRSQKVSLAPLKSLPPVAPETNYRLDLKSDLDGVRVLQLQRGGSRSLVSSLTAEFASASGSETVRAFVLSLDLHQLTELSALQSGDLAPLKQCAVPVVLSLNGEVTEAVAALATQADFVVFSDANGRGPDLLAGAICVLPEKVEAKALEIGRQIAAAPHLSLTLLKRHMRHELPPLLKGPKPAVWDLNFADNADASSMGAARKVPLATKVMELSLLEDGVACLTMNERDGCNMFTPAFMDGLEEAFAKIGELSDAKVVVLTGHASYFACGGTADGLAELQRGEGKFTDRCIYSLPLSCPLPVIAAMQGHGIGAGWSLGMYCDQAVFASEGSYHSNYLWYGFTPGAGATMIFPHRLGDALGREVLFTAREYRGKELAQRATHLTVLPSRDVLSKAMTAAHNLARKSKAELLDLKASQSQSLRDSLDAVLSREFVMHQKTLIGNQVVNERIAEKFGPAPVEASANSPAGQGVKAAVIASLAEDLMIAAEDINEGGSFLELGLDSILAVTWIRNLNKQFQIDLPATVVYAYPTVGALADHVVQLAGVSLPETKPQDSTSPEPVASPQTQRPTETPVQPRALKSKVIASLATDLMIDVSDIGEGDSFLDLGLDSILAVTWIRNLNQAFDISLPATAVYAYPTVGALVEHMTELCEASGWLAEASVPHEDEAEALSIEEPETRVPMPVLAIAEARMKPVQTANEPIAIIGSAGQFPKANTLAEYWSNIRSGRDCIEEVPASRWKIEDHYDPDPQTPGKTYCKWMGALETAGAFDARFFNITPREAELMDPQQRLFLETAWHTIEDAGLDPSQLAGSRCGVYVSSGPSGYQDLVEERNTYSLLGNSGSILASRISYLLDLRGPSLSIDTACSSSLVALAQACESLINHTCDMALAGGVCVLVGPNMFIDTAKVSMLSADGRCFSFDERANGFVPGEGVGAVLLKRLSDAERDGDPIHAVIRGWGTNQDGRTNGITAPNPKAQTALLKDVYDRFEIDPASIGLIECHGTGTPLGDPIEVEGLTDAFADVPTETSCALGSVKSNIGHLLASAGIAGVLKAQLALENREIPPSINLENLNSHIPFDKTPFVVSRDLKPWAQGGHAPRRAGVNSFGFSGTNAHVVLEEYRSARAVAKTAEPLMFVLSARNKDRLSAYASEMERFVASNQDLDLAALATTLQNGRTTFNERLAFVFRSRDELLRKLAAIEADVVLADVHRSPGEPDKVAVFETDEDARVLVEKWLRSGRPEQLTKAAELWTKGLSIDWPVSNAPRIHIPVYPFEKTLYWIEPSERAQTASTPTPDATAHPMLSPLPEAGEIGNLAIRLTGNEPYLTTHTSGEERLITALLLPEVARSAMERLAGTPIRSLEHLLWGRPVAINGKPRNLQVSAMSDPEGMLYRLEIDGADASPCHLGSVGPSVTDANRSRYEGFSGTPTGVDITSTFEAFSGHCAVYSGQPAPEMAQVDKVYRDGEVLLGRLALPRGTETDRQGMVFDPFVLDAVWRLVTFRMAGWRADAGDENALAFPLSLETLQSFAPVSQNSLLRISGDCSADGVRGAKIELFNSDGLECLRLEGLRLTKQQQIRDIVFTTSEGAEA